MNYWEYLPFVLLPHKSLSKDVSILLFLFLLFPIFLFFVFLLSFSLAASANSYPPPPPFLFLLSLLLVFIFFLFLFIPLLSVHLPTLLVVYGPHLPPFLFVSLSILPLSPLLTPSGLLIQSVCNLKMLLRCLLHLLPPPSAVLSRASPPFRGHGQGRRFKKNFFSSPSLPPLCASEDLSI